MSVLAQIAALITPCHAPDIAGGYDLCPCGRGSSWPCPVTRAAWLARGQDPAEEIHRACETARPDPLTEMREP